MWSATVDVPVNSEILYRYFISANDPTNDELHVRKWETHLEPRKCVTGVIAGQEVPLPGSYDTYGEQNGVTKVDRGWLTTETALQFIFFKNPFLLKDRVKNKQLFVKVSNESGPYFT